MGPTGTSLPVSMGNLPTQSRRPDRCHAPRDVVRNIVWHRARVSLTQRRSVRRSCFPVSPKPTDCFVRRRQERNQALFLFKPRTSCFQIRNLELRQSRKFRTTFRHGRMHLPMKPECGCMVDEMKFQSPEARGSSGVPVPRCYWTQRERMPKLDSHIGQEIAVWRIAGRRGR